MRARLLSLFLLTACASPEPGPPDTGVRPPDAGVPTDAGNADTGTAELPRRILFVVKNSNSMGAADPDARRRTLVEEAIAALEGPKVKIALLVYSDAYAAAPFSAEPAAFDEVLLRIGQNENLGVLDGALRGARAIVEEELGTGPEPDTRWSVVLLSDGYPTPTCTEAADLNPLCETPRMSWGMFGADPDDPTLYQGFDGDGTAAYNRREDAVTRINELVAFADGAGIDLRVSTILTYTESIVGQPIEGALGLNRTECAAFLEQLALLGRGNAVTEDGAAVDWETLLGP